MDGSGMPAACKRHCHCYANNYQAHKSQRPASSLPSLFAGLTPLSRPFPAPITKTPQRCGALGVASCPLTRTTPHQLFVFAKRRRAATEKARRLALGHLVLLTQGGDFGARQQSVVVKLFRTHPLMD